MIVSASRRTDIPALYYDWFFKRLKAGCFGYRNPMNPKQEHKIYCDEIDGFVFWTKNPAVMLKRLSELEGCKYYFQFTLNAYDEDIEPNIPELWKRINIFKALGKRIGRRGVIWRYDPVIFGGKYDIDFHAEKFSYLAGQLHEYTDTCIISFMDKCRIKVTGLDGGTEDMQRDLAGKFAETAEHYDLNLETCAERIDLSALGINHAHCVDSSRLGITPAIGKDKSQREFCGCCKSVDIGEYDTCNHGCIYCYARHRKTPKPGRHNEDSPFMWDYDRE